MKATFHSCDMGGVIATQFTEDCLSQLFNGAVKTDIRRVSGSEELARTALVVSGGAGLVGGARRGLHGPIQNANRNVPFARLQGLDQGFVLHPRALGLAGVLPYM